MSKFIKKVSYKKGLHPGALVHVGHQKQGKAKLTVIHYDEQNFQETEIRCVEESCPFLSETSVTWLNIDGLSDIGIIEDLQKHYRIHPMVLEDALNTGHRPKLEYHEHYLLVILKMLYISPKNSEILSEQVSLILGPNYVVSLQEVQGDVFDAIRMRIKTSVGQVRRSGADYLLNILMDAVVDNYFVILETLAERIEFLEEKVIDETGPGLAAEIHKLKREIVYLRKQIWPLREVLGGLQKKSSPLISKKNDIFIQDVYDHVIQCMDTVESFRDILSGVHDIYLSLMSNRMNEVMKVLTIFASIFIPLTFIAGVYGMNFKHMPELDSRLGYFIVLGIMIAIGGTMVAFFRKKKWI